MSDMRARHLQLAMDAATPTEQHLHQVAARAHSMAFTSELHRRQAVQATADAFDPRKGGTVLAQDGNWDEGKHGRADNGQFGAGGGGAVKKPEAKSYSDHMKDAKAGATAHKAAGGGSKAPGAKSTQEKYAVRSKGADGKYEVHHFDADDHAHAVQVAKQAMPDRNHTSSKMVKGITSEDKQWRKTEKKPEGATKPAAEGLTDADHEHNKTYGKESRITHRAGEHVVKYSPARESRGADGHYVFKDGEMKALSGHKTHEEAVAKANEHHKGSGPDKDTVLKDYKAWSGGFSPSEMTQKDHERYIKKAAATGGSVEQLRKIIDPDTYG